LSHSSHQPNLLVIIDGGAPPCCRRQQDGGVVASFVKDDVVVALRSANTWVSVTVRSYFHWLNGLGILVPSLLFGFEQRTLLFLLSLCSISQRLLICGVLRNLKLIICLFLLPIVAYG
jgi:hypothetical protein